jgi:phospholipid/cholesterol/gamma-HCH transport system ATP-binding protein
MTTPIIRVTDLSIGWDDFTLQENATFDVARGDVFVILGGSGCGKSTLLRYLIGLDTPLSGRVEINGIEPRLEGGPPQFGMMFQSGALFGSMTVGENVGLALREWTELPPEAIDAIVEAKLTLVGLEGTKGRQPRSFPGA